MTDVPCVRSRSALGPGAQAAHSRHRRLEPARVPAKDDGQAL